MKVVFNNTTLYRNYTTLTTTKQSIKYNHLTFLLFKYSTLCMYENETLIF